MNGYLFIQVLAAAWSALLDAEVLRNKLTKYRDPWIGTAIITQAVSHAGRPITYAEATQIAWAASPHHPDDHAGPLAMEAISLGRQIWRTQAQREREARINEGS